jgi:hypothetical protein
MFTVRRFPRLASALLVACSGAIPGMGGSGLPSVDIAEPVRGVLDRGYDPAVVVVQSSAVPWCAGVLLAGDVVLTALHCVASFGSPATAPPSQCSSAQPGSDPLLPPPVSLPSVRILVGADAASAVERARARGLVTPQGPNPCLADIALLLLDQPIDDIAPVHVRGTGAAQGDHLRTVGFQPEGTDALATRILKDHVPVMGTSSTGFDVYEDGCAGGCGGPALDESTGEVVGIASRWAPANGGVGPFDAYIQVDAFLDLVGEALARSAAAATSASAAALQKANKSPADLGAGCESGADCAAGACVTEGSQRYCTRRCSAHDACPTHFRCDETSERSTVCIKS